MGNNAHLKPYIRLDSIHKYLVKPSNWAKSNSVQLFK